MTQRTSLTIRENHIGHANVRHWDICNSSTYFAFI